MANGEETSVPYSSIDFEIDAFQILNDAEDYDTGINELGELYSSKTFDNPEEARSTLVNYGDSLRFKFKEALPGYEDIITIAPVSPSEVSGETDTEKINNWEKANLEYLDLTNETDYLTTKNALSMQIQNFASEARRDINHGEGVTAWLKDKFFRGVGGAVGPFAKLVGADELDRALYEQTERESDEGVAGLIAYGVGASIPFVLGSLTAGPVGGGAVLAAQTAGEARDIAQKSLALTGDPTRAAIGAATVAGSQALGVIPAGRLATSLVGTVGRTLGKKAAIEGAEAGLSKTVGEAILESLDAQKTSFTTVSRAALEAGTIGSAATVLSNIGKNIALDENGDITEGATNQFIAQALLGGALKGADALMNNALVEQTKRLVKEYIEKPTEVSSQTTSAKSGMEMFYREADGTLTPNEAALRAKDEVLRDAKETIEAESIRTPPEENLDILQNEMGEKVDTPLGADYETPDIPANTVLTNDPSMYPNVTGGRLAQFLASRFGAELQARRNVMDGAFGSYQPSSKRVKILRSLGANPKKFLETLSHELGHFIDDKFNDAFSEKNVLRTVSQKLSGLKGLIQEALPAEKLDFRAAQLSSKWRPGWDGIVGGEPGSFRAYRSQPVEIYADVVSSLLKGRDWVQREFPEIYKAFEDSLNRNPELQAFWDWYKKVDSDPAELSKLNAIMFHDAARRGAKVNLEAVEARNADNTLGARLKRHYDFAYRYIVDKVLPAREIVRNLPEDARNVGFDLLNDISRTGYLPDYLTRVINKPLQELRFKFDQSGIPLLTWDRFLWNKRILEEETTTMARVKENYPLYRDAAVEIRRLLSEDPSIKSSILFDALNFDKITNAEQLNDAMAQLGIIGDTASVLSKEDFINRYDPTDPARDAKGTRDYLLATESLNRRKQSIPIEKVREKVGGLKESPLKDAMSDLLGDNAFAARRYLINPGGTNRYDAVADNEQIRHSLGPEKYKKLLDYSQQFHNILKAPFDIIAKSQMMSPDMLARMRLNSDNYVTANNLNYYEGDEHVSSSVRRAIGSLGEIGSVLASTPVKTKKIVAAAYRQTANNAAVNLAELAGQVVERTKWSPGSNLFAEKTKLSATDPDHSYIVSYKEGIPTLNKISGGKRFEQMFESSRDLPGLSVVMELADALNKVFLTRQLKTVFSPAFVLAQKYYDRKLEAIIANSAEFQFGLPFHSGKKLREIDSSTKDAIRDYKKTGNLTGNLKKVVDLDVATLQLSLLDEANLNKGTSFENAVYDSYGVKVPDENSVLDKIGDFAEATLEKVGFGFIKNIAEFDELRSKVNGFTIAKEILGMSDAEAAVFARERFGVPDPRGGGIAAPAINRMFLFGVAHVNGLRSLGTNIKEMPKTMALQLAYRAVLPKLILSSAVMGAAFRLNGDEDGAQKYEMLNDMIGSFDKIAKIPIILGAQDGKGNFHNFFDIKASDIQSDWKAWYWRIPQSRELTTLNKLIFPTIDALGTGRELSTFLSGSQSVVSGNLQPAIQYMGNLLAIAQGKNPEDYFRQKGVFSRELQEGGTTLDKLTEYGKYLGASQFSNVIPYDVFQSTDPKGTTEAVIRKGPLIGPMARAMVGITNYGLVEKSKNAEEMEKRETAEIKLSTDEYTKELFEQTRRANGAISSLGKGWQVKVGPEVSIKYRQLISWQNRIWHPYQRELKAAKDAGDFERYSYLLGELESSSKNILDSLSLSEEPEQ